MTSRTRSSDVQHVTVSEKRHKAENSGTQKILQSVLHFFFPRTTTKILPHHIDFTLNNMNNWINLWWEKHRKKANLFSLFEVFCARFESTSRLLAFTWLLYKRSSISFTRSVIWSASELIKNLFVFHEVLIFLVTQSNVKLSWIVTINTAAEKSIKLPQ